MIPMKNLLKINFISIMAMLFALNLSCNSDDNGTSTPVPETDLIQVVNSKADLSILVAALERADLTATLQGNNKLTLLAPTDNAFNGFFVINGIGGIDDIPVATLRRLLLNHLLTGPVDLANLEAFDKRYTQTLAEIPASGFNLAIFFDTADGVVFNGSSKVTESDIFASNGILHMVDNVIDIPTIETFVSADNELSDLEAALELSEDQSTIPSMIQDDQSGPLTLFAPSNAAFQALLASNSNWNALGDIDESLLKSIIEHHVLNEEVRTQGLAPVTTFPTLEGDDITLNFLAGRLEITDGSGVAGRIVKITDIQAVNGAIHILEDQVLMPDPSN